MIRFLFASRLWRMLILPVAIFGPLAYYTEDRALILVLNIVQVGIAVSVVTAFTPEVWRILTGSRPMSRGSYMAYGIWVGWGSIVWRTTESLIWRIMGQPGWLINSDVTSAYLYMGIIGAASHIIRPGELDERIPPRETIRIGLIIGVMTMIGLMIVYLPEICAAWHPRPAGQHDTAPGRLIG